MALCQSILRRARQVGSHGLPNTVQELAKAECMGIEDITQYTDHLQKMGIPVTVDQFRLTSANSIVLWEMVKRGLGIGAMLREVADQTPGLVRLLPELPAISVPVWLVTHSEIRTSPRIRAVFDILAEELAKSA